MHVDETQPHRGRRPQGSPAQKGGRGTGSKGAGRPAYKANLVKRIGSGVLDLGFGVIPGVVFLVWGWWWLTAVLLGVYLLVRDGLGIPALDRQSPGKKIGGCSAEMRDTGKPVSIVVSAKRNLPLALGFLLVPVLGQINLLFALVVAAAPLVAELVMAIRDDEGLRYGDQLAGTKVLD